MDTFVRSLSLGLFNTQDLHCHIRLLSTLEMLTHPEYYDIKNPAYADIIRDEKFFVSRLVKKNVHKLSSAQISFELHTFQFIYIA